MNSKAAPSIASDPDPDDDSSNPASASDSNQDGLRIFDKNAPNILKAQGIGFYPSIHEEFLSSVGSLSIDMSVRCSNCDSDLIPRSSNRLIILGEMRPFLMATNESSAQAYLEDTHRTGLDTLTFEETTALALVVVLGKTAN